MSKAAKTLFQRFFPIDVYPVLAPTIAAAVLAGTMITRFMSSDPEANRHKWATEDEGAKYRQSIRGYFKSRLDNGSKSIFSNEKGMVDTQGGGA